jgi:UDP-N-acetylglucosamine 2-epimerase
MKIISIVGARPQFIKVAPICHKMAENGIESIIIHTGQHYDYQLSDIFFDELNIPAPDFNLEIGEQKPVMQISQIIKGLFPIIEEVKPDCAIVYGDTNSTLAASISLVKQNIPIIHIEGGERNFTSDMKLVNSTTIPEETNRILTDHISELIFCATSRAVTNLENGNERKSRHEKCPDQVD